MKTNVLKLSTLLLILFVLSCKKEKDELDLLTLKPLIENNGKQWSKALKTKDILIIKNLYDENAHYLPDGDVSLHGNTAIVNYWQASFDFLNDLHLYMETLEGTKELLYETGNGIALIPNKNNTSDTLRFKYTNVWKLQSNGSYKVVIDMFNDLK